VEKTRYVAVAQLQALEDLSARLVILPDEVGEEVGRDLLRLESAQSYLRESPENLLVRMVKARTDGCRKLPANLGGPGSIVLSPRCMSSLFVLMLLCLWLYIILSGKMHSYPRVH